MTTKHRSHVFDEKNVRDDVKLQLGGLKGYKLRVFKVDSGDTGKEYWVQLLTVPRFGPQLLMAKALIRMEANAKLHSDKDSLLETAISLSKEILKEKTDFNTIALCDCPHGKWFQPLEMLFLGHEETRCKHVKALLTGLEER